MEDVKGLDIVEGLAEDRKYWVSGHQDQTSCDKRAVKY